MNLYELAKKAAECSPDGVGVAQSKHQKVVYTVGGFLGFGDSIESVRFIPSPIINPDGTQEDSDVESDNAEP